MTYGQEVVHIATEHWWIVILLFAAMLAVVAAALKIRRMRREMQASLSRLSASERMLDTSKRQITEKDLLIKRLKEKVKDIEGSVERGVTSALISCGLKAVSLETFGELSEQNDSTNLEFDDATSADAGLTAEEEEEIDELETILDDEENLSDIQKNPN